MPPLDSDDESEEENNVNSTQTASTNRSALAQSSVLPKSPRLAKAENNYSSLVDLRHMPSHLERKKRERHLHVNPATTANNKALPNVSTQDIRAALNEARAARDMCQTQVDMLRKQTENKKLHKA